MGLRNSSVLCLALFLAFSSSIQGLDIVNSLSKHPEFAKFSQYLAQTKLADQINSQKAATVFALDDAALASLAGKSVDVIKAVLGAQVIPDFYDQKKLMEAQGGHEKISTLTGSGIYVGLIGEGEMAFSTGANNDKYNSKLVKNVVIEGTTLAVLQVTETIDKPSSAAPSNSAPSSSTPAASSSPSTSTTPASSSSAPVAAETKPAAVGGAAPAPAPSSGSRVVMGLVGGAVIAFASSLFISL